MFAQFFHKSEKQSPHQGYLKPADFDPRVTVHYGIPATASILAFDPIQSLMAVGTLDGRIKVIGGENIEALLVCPKPLSFKYLEFLHNLGFLVSISNKNEIQVWDLENRRIVSTLQWGCNITAFSVIYGTHYMYIGSESAMVAVIKFEAEHGKITILPYYVPADVIAEAAGMSFPEHLSVVGVLQQPCSPGSRILIAYENGLIVLWDASEDKVVLVRGNKDLQLKDGNVVSLSKDTREELSSNVSSEEEVEKEISSLCWVASDGSVLAVGYVDGDILFWNLSTTSIKEQQANKPSNNVVKLQLSSGNTRLPVIFLHWSASRLHDHEGKLFVYGGDEIGSPETLSILSLNWSSGIESLKCTGRVDLTLDGSFADMVISSRIGSVKSSATFLFVLTNPGQLHVYDDICLSSLVNQQEKHCSVSPVPHPMVIPNIEPYISAVKLALVYRDSKFSRALVERALAAKLHTTRTPMAVDTKWPLTGGVHCKLSDAENYQVERVYIAGYQDGSVRIWDATYPTLSHIFYFESEVKGVQIAGTSALVSALGFCSISLRLAVGNECGLVRLYSLVGSSDETNFHFITQTEKEVHSMHRGEGPHCAAMFSFLNSSVTTLQFANSGAILAVGFDCGRVAMIDIYTLSLLFLTDDVSNSKAPVISLAIKSFSDSNTLVSNSNNSVTESEDHPRKEIVLILSRDSNLVTINISTGHMIRSQFLSPEKESTAISMYIIEDDNTISEASSQKHFTNNPQSSGENVEPLPASIPALETPDKVQVEMIPANLYFLLCCETTILLYSLKSVIEGESKCIHKVNLVKPCCWTTALKKEGKECGLIILYQNGVIEIRSLPDLEKVEESSLELILRWNFKTNMDKTICSSDNGKITLLNGCEFAFVSLLKDENDFRIPESLSHLYNKVIEASADGPAYLSPSHSRKQGATRILDVVKGFKIGKLEHSTDSPGVSTNKVHEASADGSINVSPTQNIKQGATRILDVVKSFKIGKPEDSTDSSEVSTNEVPEGSADGSVNVSPAQNIKQGASWLLGGVVKGLKAGKKEHKLDPPETFVNKEAHLESLFSSPPFLKPSKGVTDEQETVELNLDDIKIDEPIAVTVSPITREEQKKDKATERESLFDGASSDVKPKVRTAEEIKAKYRKIDDTGAAAARARDKLVERQEKLNRLDERTAELRDGAEDFADMAKELAKRMENRKWWQL